MEAEAIITGAETDEDGKWREVSSNNRPTLRAVPTICPVWESCIRQPREEKNRFKPSSVSWPTDKRLRCSLGTQKTSETDKLGVEMELTWLTVMAEPSAVVIVGKTGGVWALVRWGLSVMWLQQAESKNHLEEIPGVTERVGLDALEDGGWTWLKRAYRSVML